MSLTTPVYAMASQSDPFYVKGTQNAVASKPDVSYCYAQALGIVVVGSLLVELLGRIKSRSGRPSCHATLGQNLGVWQGSRVQGKLGNQPEDRGFTR